ncbi:MAG: hypothetical protein IKS83_04005 [Victivallales bacterium]|nr:hypothetical protein [Victivallales bacterium]
MKFIVKCPHCSNLFTVEDNWAGQITNCPICGKEVRVPQPPPASPGQTSSGNLDFQAERGESQFGMACASFFLTWLCCMPVGLAMAINTHFKMKENNNYHGFFWLILTYVLAPLQVIHAIALIFYFKNNPMLPF